MNSTGFLQAGSMVACPECDVLHRRLSLPRGAKARCVRCGAVLYRRSHLRPDQLLPLLVGAVVTFVLANAFPIVDLQVQGHHNSATLFGSILSLWEEGRTLVAALVFATTELFPLADLLTMLALLLAQRRGRPGPAWRLVQALRPWGMIEVFMLGVLVALVKLSHLAQVVPGVALWAFAALTVILAVILSFDPRSLLDLPRGEVPRAVTHPPTGEAKPVACGSCGLICSGHVPARCPRCGGRLQRRKADSVSRSMAFLAAAAILYIPANLLPVMETSSMFGAEKDTILSGIVYFWTSGSQGLAALIFFVSILIPLLKLGTLGSLAWSVWRRSPHHPHQRATLFRVIELVGRWSMLDVFVVALMVGLVNFRGLAVIQAGPGAAAFGAVVVLTMLATRSFDPRLIWDCAQEEHD